MKREEIVGKIFMTTMFFAGTLGVLVGSLLQIGSF